MAAINDIINGTDITVYVAGTAVAYATSGTINLTHSPRETTNKDSGGYKSSLEGLRDWSIDLDGMYAWTSAAAGAITNADDLFASYIETRTVFEITWGTTVTGTGNTKYVGQAWVTSITMTGSTEESSTYSASFEGTGSIVQTVAS